MRFTLAAPAVFATAAQALGIKFLNDLPVNATHKIGTELVLEWNSDGATANDTFELSIIAWNTTAYSYSSGLFGLRVPHYDTIQVVLNDAEKFFDGVYPWTIQPLDDKGLWKGDGFYYSFTAHFGNTRVSTNNFHITD